MAALEEVPKGVPGDPEGFSSTLAAMPQHVNA